MSPAVSVSAALQSIIPAPVVSRRSLTIAAVIVAMWNVLLPFRIDRGASKRDAATGRQVLEK